jgi:glutamyl-tRNA reductase
MHYLVISFSHKNTDIKTREKLAFNTEAKLEEFIESSLKNQVINEAIILSTCNRVEIILSVKDVLQSSEFILKKLSLFSGLNYDELSGRAEVFEDSGAIHHLFMVASSLDSLVVGETQITGQLKNSFNFSYERGFCSQKLSRAMHYAFKCAKRVRNSTDISKNPVSVASSAVSKAKDILGGELGGYTALVIGAGEMSLLAIKHLVTAGCNIILVNRDIEKANEIAKEFTPLVTVQSFSKISELINRYRILFTATGAPHSVITKDMVERRNFKRYWFDIAVPMDIEDIEDDEVFVYRVDDLKDIVNKNIALREEQARVAYSIIGQSTNEFFKWLQNLSIEPIIKELRNSAKAISLDVSQNCIKKGFIPIEFENNLQKAIDSAFNKFLHTPTVRLKNIADEPIADSILESTKFVFDIESDFKLLDSYICEHNK